MNILEVRNLTVSFNMYEKGTQQKLLPVISDLNIRLRPGEIHAVLGSSGSGKSLLAHAILGILPENAICTGELLWEGKAMTPQLQKKLRGRELALVPQSVSFLDPLQKAGRQISSDRKTAEEALAACGLEPSAAQRYPFELSGGMTRRVLLATAAAAGAKLILADEPTPGLSEELAQKAMERFRAFADGGAAVLLITHDAELAERYADRISVFYAGTTVETLTASDFRDPAALRHPYTRALWHAMPQHDFKPIPGSQPYPGSLPLGCLFAPRCPLATERCRQERPESRTLKGGEVSCHYAD